MAIAHLPASARIRPRTVAAGALLAVSAGVLAVQLRHVPFRDLLAHVRIGWLALAFGAFAVSLGAAAHNISAFAPLRLRALDTVRAQLAVGALRIVAPAAVSTPAIGARFLTRSGLALSESLAVVATAQTAQLLMTVVVVGAIAVAGSTALPLPDLRTTALVGVALAVVLVLAVVVGGRYAPVRRTLTRSRAAVRSVAGHLRHRPVRVLTGLAASAALTLAHVTAFACCVHAVGGNASVCWR